MPVDLGQLLGTIKAGVVGSLSWTAARNTNLYIDSRLMKKGEDLLAYKQHIPIERDTFMVFADEAPRFNWSHPCRFLLHDATTGERYREVKAQFPPYMTVEIPKTYQPFHQPVRTADARMIYPILPRLRCPMRWQIGQRYAVLFSGSSWNRHTNDLEFLYRTLRDIYAFPAGNIYVLNYNGTVNYIGDPHPVGNYPGGAAYRLPVNGQGTKTDLDSVLDTLKGKLQADDVLLIHANNHGGHNGTESYLCTYSGDDYLASSFAAKLGTLPKYKCLMVMMEQCHSGGFNAPILAHSTADYTSVSSACEELRNSAGYSDFDPFAENWISAMTGSTPYGGALASNPDTDGSGKVSAREAHNYAEAVNTAGDTPVYSESSGAAGDFFLGQRYWYIWPIYCRLLVRYLQPYYERIPIPEFYEMVNTKLVPQLKDVEAKLGTVSQSQELELSKTLSVIIKKVMG